MFFQCRVWKKTISSRKCSSRLATGLICEVLKRAEKVVGMKAFSLPVTSQLCLISIDVFISSLKFLYASLHSTRKFWRQKVCKFRCTVGKNNTIGEFISLWTKQTANWNPTFVSKAFHTCLGEMDFPKFCYSRVCYYHIFFRLIDFLSHLSRPSDFHHQWLNGVRHVKSDRPREKTNIGALANGYKPLTACHAVFTYRNPLKYPSPISLNLASLTVRYRM